MKRSPFPYIAVALGLALLLAVTKRSTTNAEGETLLPLLTLLLACEFGLILSAFGAYFGVRQIRSVGLAPGYVVASVVCVLLSVCFLVLGINLWPQ